MNEKLTQIEDAVANLLKNKEDVSQEEIRNKVSSVAIIQGGLSQKDVDDIVKKLEERFTISMGFGSIFADPETYKPWLDNVKTTFEWYYWNRYKRYLLNHKKFSPSVIRSSDSITDKILDYLENPKKEGTWKRKGMVVGHVQSGKTANYIGLLTKAADSGYKVIVILAGMLNSLRNQTQLRVDEGFIGLKQLRNGMKITTGVGEINNEKKPASFTTNSQDFNRNIANQLGIGLGELKEPVILVIKKNKSTFENLIDWLKNNNKHKLQDYPMLLIDDEADHASINTRKKNEDPATINRKIRELLNLFTRSSYLGYTATPFANIFIDPENENDMIGDDLFPRDFILNLDAPTNYFGAKKIFSEENDLDVLVPVNDFEDHLPLKHKKDFDPSLPNSLKEAVCSFIIVKTIRLLRNHLNQNHSMIINVSRFVWVQTKLKDLISEYLKEVAISIKNYSKCSTEIALKNQIISDIKNNFDLNFNSIEFSWNDVQNRLLDSVSNIGVIEVNGSSTSEKLDYSKENYPNGRSVVAIGGLSLSRGLTLEGLSVSYFLRNSVMYDTLMQMGRWFGYRNGYEDLCRIYMSDSAISWYSHISDVMEELRSEFTKMQRAGMTPKDFGLCVRSHPESLVVTARNKMRSGKKIPRQISLEGRLIETAVLLKNKDALENNLNLLNRFVEEISSKFSCKRIDEKVYGYFWEDIPKELVMNLIRNFDNHPISQITYCEPINNFIKEYCETFDIVLISLKEKEERNFLKIGNFKIYKQSRNFSIENENAIFINKKRRRVGAAIQESLGLKNLVKLESEFLKENPQKNTISGSFYRRKRTKPLLILHVLKCEEKINGKIVNTIDNVFAYGISFNGEAGTGRPKKLVEYIVNPIWWENYYSDSIEEDLENGEFDD